MLDLDVGVIVDRGVPDLDRAHVDRPIAPDQNEAEKLIVAHDLGVGSRAIRRDHAVRPQNDRDGRIGGQPVARCREVIGRALCPVLGLPGAEERGGGVGDRHRDRCACDGRAERAHRKSKDLGRYDWRGLSCKDRNQRDRILQRDAEVDRSARLRARLGPEILRDVIPADEGVDVLAVALVGDERRDHLIERLPCHDANDEPIVLGERVQDQRDLDIFGESSVFMWDDAIQGDKLRSRAARNDCPPYSAKRRILRPLLHEERTPAR